jgi:hypothetical protein
MSNIESNEKCEENNECLIDTNSDYEFEDQLDCNQIHINSLPYVVFEYILSHLSPYRELSDCKLVSKSWRMSVKCKSLSFIYDLINH